MSPLVTGIMLNTVLVWTHMQFIETYRFYLRLCGSHLVGHWLDFWRWHLASSYGVAYSHQWVTETRSAYCILDLHSSYWNKVSEVKLKRIFMCFFCSVDFNMFLDPLLDSRGSRARPGDRQMASNLIMHIHRWLPNKAKRSVGYHELTTLCACT